MASKEINEAPALESKYEEFRNYLYITLDKLDPAKITDEINKAHGLSQDMETASYDPAQYASLAFALGQLGRLKAQQNKDRILEELAQKRLFEIAQAELLVRQGECKGDIGDAVSQLHVAVNALAQSRYAEDYEKQIRNAKSIPDEIIAKMRKKFKKMKIS